MRSFFMILLIFFISFYCCESFSQENMRTIKITEIDSTKSFYFIKGKSKEVSKEKFLIVSKKDTTFPIKNRIKIGCTYNLILKNYLSKDEINRLPKKNPGTLLIREEGYIIWDGKMHLPYKSPNLRSLNYIKEN